MDEGEWELCTFALDGQEIGVRRSDGSTPTRIPLSCVQEVRVHRVDDDAVDMLELFARNGRSMAARPRAELVDTMLACVWDANVTVTTSNATVSS